MDRAGFERFDSEAGIGVAGRGGDLPAAFAQAALGMFAVMVSPDSVEEREIREVRAHAGSLEPLLVSWLNECLYVHEVEGFVAGRIDFVVFDAVPGAGGEPLRLHARLHGEEIDPARHRRQGAEPQVKGALPGHVQVSSVAGGFEVRAVLEV